jgi:hypothetical protein
MRHLAWRRDRNREHKIATTASKPNLLGRRGRDASGWRRASQALASSCASGDRRHEPQSASASCGWAAYGDASIFHLLAGSSVDSRLAAGAESRRPS